MNYTEKHVEAILNRVWEDRLKGGGWKDKESFINTMKQVKNLPIADVSVPKGTFVCSNCGHNKTRDIGYGKQCGNCLEDAIQTNAL